MYGWAQQWCLYGGGASWLRCSVFGHIQAPICIVWVVFLSSQAVFLHFNHLYICYGAALLSLGLFGGGGGSPLLLLTMLSLRDLCPVAYGCKVVAPPFVSCYFLSCYFFVWSYLVILLSFLSFVFHFLVHSFVCVGLRCPIVYRCRVMLPGN